MSNTTEELQTLFPDESITVNGEELKIKPLTFGQLPKALKVMEKLGGLFVQTFGKEDATQADMLSFLAQGGDELLELICMGVGKPKSWFDNVPMDEGIQLSIKFVEVNSSFFTQRVLPLLVKVTPAVKDKITGQT